VNQLSWTYLADHGKQHHVGLAHGAETGHLVIHCNGKVILIDFEVLEDASYSVFIDEQLCEISIEKQSDKFFYSFEINSQADTPRNRARKKLEKQHLMQSMAFLGTLVFIISVAIFAMTRWASSHDRQNMATKLNHTGQEVSARILIPEDKAIEYASYYFIVNGKSYATSTTYATAKTALLPNGFPLEEGDEFIVTYLPDNPTLSEIHYERPTKFQLQRYRERAIQQSLKANPSAKSTEITCAVDQIFAEKGIEGIVHLYFQNTPKNQNTRHNQASFRQLVNQSTIKSKIQEHCDSFPF